MRHDSKKIIAGLKTTGKSSTWIKIGALLDGSYHKPVKDAHIVYNADEIVFVGHENNTPPAKILPANQKEPNLNLPDFTLLPGLIDAHAHLFLTGSELDFQKRQAYQQKPSEDMITSALKRQQKLLQFGVIAVRDAGDKYGVGPALSKIYKSNERQMMPYIDSPGAAIYHRGHYGGFMSKAIEDYSSLKDCVEDRIYSGADRIKLIATGIIDFKSGSITKPPQMSAEEVSSVVSIAKSFGRQTFAHASGDTGIENVIAGGVDSVEHGFFIREDQLGKMSDRQIAWVPTFAPVQAQLDNADIFGWDEGTKSNLHRILARHMESLTKASRMGVQIIAGSDAGSQGVPHGLGLLYELELMVRAGLNPISVINTATGNSSKWLGFKENFGKIQPGYKSRFILTRNSPVENITNLRKDKYVIFDGAAIHFEEVSDLEDL